MPIYANPVGGTVSAGQANISESGTTLNINQQSSKAVIDWRGFDIAPGETTQFIQPSSSAIALNRINSNSASHIDGNLTANGNIVIINQNGVMFGGGATVDVNGLIATTADIGNDAFMNSTGKLNFNQAGNPDAAIVNNGVITAAAAGLVGFVAPNVANNGVITAKLGKVHLASGDTATVDMYGDGLIKVAVSDNVRSQLVSNSGLIEADGGTVALTAAAGQYIVNSLITNSGTLQAQSVAQVNGEIIIGAMGSNAVAGTVTADKGVKSGNSTVINSGTLSASGKNSGETGGSVSVLGDNVGLLSGSVIDVSGDAGGGSVKVGGDFHGKGTTATAKRTYVDANATINADAITIGNGGTVAVWADDRTQFGGSISARGGAQSGNGGFVETSGHNVLGFNGFVDTRATNGNGGTLLLDPTDITISTSANTGTMTFSGGQFADTTASSSNLNVTTLQNQLASSNVLVTSASGLGGTGNLSVNNAVTWSSANSLTLFASNNLTINAGITYTGNSANSLTLQANSDILVWTSSPITATGTGKLDITLNSDRDASGAGGIAIDSNISSNGGNITMGGGNAGITTTSGYTYGDASNSGYGLSVNAATVNASGGDIIMNGIGSSTAAYGVLLYGGSAKIQTSGSGNITLNGSGGAGAASASGFGVGSGTTISSASGNININGTATGTGTGIVLNSANGSLSSITAGSGSITLTGIRTSSNGINSASTATFSIGNGSDTGNITIISDKVALSNVTILTTGNGTNTGIVTIQPYSQNGTVGFGGTTPTGTLKITQAIMDAITAPTVTIGRSDSTGTLTTDTYAWNSANGLTTLNLYGNNVVIGNTITKSVATAGNADANLNIYANNDITVNASSAISSSSTFGKLNMMFDANFDASATGEITIGSNLSSNGGTITLGGGSGVISSGTGFATGEANSGTEYGVYLNAITLDAAGGNIIINGLGGAYASGTNYGIYMNGATVKTSSTGTIALNGTGGTSSTSNYGIYI